MNLPSKELLSEVMKKEVEYVESNLCYFEEFSSCMQGITFKGNSHREYWNIHELSHKCKEWANDNSYFIHIRNDHRIGRTKYTAETGTDLSSIFGVESFYGDDELDVIFRACQWILDNKEKQNER